MDFRERKQQRKDYYMKYIHGRRLVKCIACNGSGRYDNHGSPKCSSCEGTGKSVETDWEKKQRESVDNAT